MDRNHIDLNRVDQVTTKAPWFLARIDILVDQILARHREARVVVVHGWNVSQIRCDIGVGANLETHQVGSGSDLTVSIDFLVRYLTPLTAIPEAQATLGDRYPARHRNNLLQLFRRDGSRSDALPERLAGHVRAQRCQAVQLELGIPLRWPGPRREAFLPRLCSILRGDRQPAPTTASNSDTTTATTHSLQFFDPASDVTLLAGVERLPATRAFTGRLAIFLPDGRVALYTGEARDARSLGRDGPIFRRIREIRGGRESLELAFDGSMLVTPDGDGYVDLEYALSRAVLEPARLQLRLDAANGQVHGIVRGQVELGGRRSKIDTTGFTAPGEWGARHRAGRSQVSVRARFDDGSAAVLRSRTSAGTADYVRVELADDGYSPESITIAIGDQVSHIRPLNRMEIARPVGAKRRARVTFGPATIEIEGTTTHGTAIYEYLRLVDR